MQAEEILIGCFVECQSIKKVGGRRSVEELYQALFLTGEVELEQSCQEGRLVWSVKIRRVRLTRCVFRYGPRDGMTYSAVKPID